MPYLVVCPITKIDETARKHNARHMISTVSPDMDVARPSVIAPENHLRLSFNDIAAPRDGLTLAGALDVEKLIDFAGKWDRGTPLLIHCFAGVSRSTASAYTIALALNPSLDPMILAKELRLRSPTATPNPRLIAVADDILGYGGAMVSAIAAIGRGAHCFEGAPFVLPARYTPTDKIS